jgi:hypothetical protein
MMARKERMPARKTGRPSKLTPEIAERITKAIVAGTPFDSAAALAGVSRETLRGWARRGAEESAGPHRDFVEGVDRALAEYEQKLLTAIQTAAMNGTASAAMWLLERRWPDRWSKREKRVGYDEFRVLREDQTNDKRTRAVLEGDTTALRVSVAEAIGATLERLRGQLDQISPSALASNLASLSKLQDQLGGPELSYPEIHFYMGSPAEPEPKALGPGSPGGEEQP